MPCECCSHMCVCARRDTTSQGTAAGVTRMATSGSQVSTLSLFCAHGPSHVLDMCNLVRVELSIVCCCMLADEATALEGPMPAFGKLTPLRRSKAQFCSPHPRFASPTQPLPHLYPTPTMTPSSTDFPCIAFNAGQSAPHDGFSGPSQTHANNCVFVLMT